MSGQSLQGIQTEFAAGDTHTMIAPSARRLAATATRRAARPICVRHLAPAPWSVRDSLTTTGKPPAFAHCAGRGQSAAVACGARPVAACILLNISILISAIAIVISFLAFSAGWGQGAAHVHSARPGGGGRLAAEGEPRGGAVGTAGGAGRRSGAGPRRWRHQVKTLSCHDLDIARTSNVESGEAVGSRWRRTLPPRR